MPRSAYLQVVNHVLEDVFDREGNRTAYCQQMLTFLDQFLPRDEVELTASVLPILTCRACGGDSHQAVPVVTAWQLISLAVKLLDDIEDNEGSNQTGVDINTITGTVLVAQLLLDELRDQGVSSNCAQRMGRALRRAMLRACAGQHADLMVGRGGVGSIDPETWLEIAGAKSGEFFAWAAWTGALVAGATETVLTCYHEWGYHLGVLRQVADDFKDVWSSEGDSDLAAGRPTLPVCYALQVTKGKEREQLEALLLRAARRDSAAEAQAKQMLIDVGAQHYLLVVARVQHHLARAALRRAKPVPIPGRQLVALLDRTMPAATLEHKVAQ